MAEVVHVATGNSGSAPRSDVTVEAFLGWLQVERGRASATVEAYRRDLTAHLAWLDDAGLRTDGEV